MRTTLFVEVLLPLPVDGYFTYRVPFEWNADIAIGKRVIVQFGRKKIFTALIRNILTTPPKHQVKYISYILDDKPIVSQNQFEMWEWIASYYMCTIGEVMNVAIPSGLKLTSETKIILNKDIEIDEENLTLKEFELIEILKTKEKHTVTEISNQLETGNIMPLINTLIEKGYVETDEEIKTRYTPKTATVIRLSKKYHSEKALEELYNQLEKSRASKQLEVLISYIQLSNIIITGIPIEIERSKILESVASGSNSLRMLIKKEIFEEDQIIVKRSRIFTEHKNIQLPKLSDKQSFAYGKIKSAFNKNKVVLLHGVTSSGKTELYIHLIKECIESGKQALFLLPEIALTTQIVSRVQKYFGNSMGVYHSRYNENERAELWRDIANANEDSPKLILGARSALFLPFSNLGLIIIDEEHDTSYKQYDPAPRYNARDTAIFMSSLVKANIVLGSATPSIESYYNAVNGKYELVQLKERYGGVKLPDIKLINMRQAAKGREVTAMFSNELLLKLKNTFEQKNQAILFQNRRGFSINVLCRNCNWVPYCINCDVSLVYHKSENRMRCHYCGYTTDIPNLCPECGNTALLMKGYGTEKIEEELKKVFPEIKVSRMDVDSVRRKDSHSRIINDFETRKIDALVGTQMVIKGFDFENVTLVCIVNADNMLTYPDFRAFERAFQMMSQLAGRSGRRNVEGQVFIQAHNDSHPVLKMVIEHNYDGFYKYQIAERERFLYPPFSRLVQISVRHMDFETTQNAAANIAKILRKTFGKRVLGPEFPPVSKIRNLYIKNILLKLEQGISLHKSKQVIMDSIGVMHKMSGFSGVRVVVDVDVM